MVSMISIHPSVLLSLSWNEGESNENNNDDNVTQKAGWEVDQGHWVDTLSNTKARKKGTAFHNLPIDVVATYK